MAGSEGGEKGGGGGVATPWSTGRHLARVGTNQPPTNAPQKRKNFAPCQSLTRVNTRLELRQDPRLGIKFGPCRPAALQVDLEQLEHKDVLLFPNAVDVWRQVICNKRGGGKEVMI